MRIRVIGQKKVMEKFSQSHIPWNHSSEGEMSMHELIPKTRGM